MVNSSYSLHSWGTLHGPLQCIERDGEEVERGRKEKGRVAGPTQQRNAVRAFREGYKLQKGTGNKGRKTDYK